MMQLLLLIVGLVLQLVGGAAGAARIVLLSRPDARQGLARTLSIVGTACMLSGMAALFAIQAMK